MGGGGGYFGNKSRDMCYSVCGMVIIGKSSQYGGSWFPP